MEFVQIYIAGPLGADPAHINTNVAKALVVAAWATMLADVAGFKAVYVHVPHTLQFAQEALQACGITRPYGLWMAGDLALVSKCDVLVRLQGVSPGADIEVQHAREAGVPVVEVSLSDSAATVFDVKPQGLHLETVLRQLRRGAQ